MTARRNCLLLVEDDTLVRMTVAMMLEDDGYGVVEAGSATEAWHLVDEGLQVDAVVTDVDLGQGPTGVQMADGLRNSLPDVAVVFITGRPASMLGRVLGPREALLAKPFQSSDLARKLHELVDLPGA